MKDISYSLIKSSIQTIISTCIWVPYFLVSKRVKATFLNMKVKNDGVATTIDYKHKIRPEEKTNIHSKKLSLIFERGLGKITFMGAAIIGYLVIKFLFN